MTAGLAPGVMTMSPRRLSIREDRVKNLQFIYFFDPSSRCSRETGLFVTSYEYVPCLYMEEGPIFYADYCISFFF